MQAGKRVVGSRGVAMGAIVLCVAVWSPRAGAAPPPWTPSDAAQASATLEGDVHRAEAAYDAARIVVPPRPELIAAIGLAGASLGLGIGSGAAWGASQTQAQLLYQGVHVGESPTPYLEAGQSAATASGVLGVTSLLSGLGAGTLAVLMWKPWPPSGPAKWGAVPVVEPVPGGVALRVVGRW